MSSYSGILDVAIGMVFVYLLLSLICSAMTEMLETWFKQRGKNLWRGLTELLYDKQGAFVEQLYKDPLIYGLYSGDQPSAKSRNLPSYIASRTFALALIHQIVNGQNLHGQALTVQHIKEGLRKNTDLPEALKPLLLVLINTAGDDLEKAIKSIEAWYDNATDRIAGWYKRHTQWVAFFAGLAIAAVGNVDSLTLVRSLSSDDALRSALVSASGEYAKARKEETGVGGQKHDVGKGQSASSEACGAKNSPECQAAKACEDEAASGSSACLYYTNLAQLNSLGLPIGWNTGDPRTVSPEGWAWVNKVIGLLMSGIAASFGAPFWFDMLNKIMKFRTAIRPESQDKRKSE